MKIGQPSEKPVPVNPPTQPVPPKGGQNASANAAAAQGDTHAKGAAASGKQTAGVAVTVSTLARTLAAGDASEVDAKKVESVRAAIEQGTFKVNAEAIADKLLANAEEMLNRNRG